MGCDGVSRHTVSRYMKYVLFHRIPRWTQILLMCLRLPTKYLVGELFQFVAVMGYNNDPIPRLGPRPEEDDPEEKRVRFLERNRAAASRCRARKKLWVDNLENKAKELEV